MSDTINSPSHYAAGGMEPIDYLKLKLTPEEFAGFCKGNVIKYLSRAKHKNGEEDLKKAAFYARFLAGDDPRKEMTTVRADAVDYPQSGRYETQSELLNLYRYATSCAMRLFILPDPMPPKGPVTTSQVLQECGKYEIVCHSVPEGYRLFPGR